MQYALLEGVDWPQLSRMLLPPMLSAAALQKASESLAKRAAVDEVCRAFQVQDKEELQVCVAKLVWVHGAGAGVHDAACAPPAAQQQLLCVGRDHVLADLGICCRQPTPLLCSHPASDHLIMSFINRRTANASAPLSPFYPPTHLPTHPTR